MSNDETPVRQHLKLKILDGWGLETSIKEMAPRDKGRISQAALGSGNNYLFYPNP